MCEEMLTLISNQEKQMKTTWAILCHSSYVKNLKSPTVVYIDIDTKK